MADSSVLRLEVARERICSLDSHRLAEGEIYVGYFIRTLSKATRILIEDEVSVRVKTVGSSRSCLADSSMDGQPRLGAPIQKVPRAAHPSPFDHRFRRPYSERREGKVRNSSLQIAVRWKPGVPRCFEQSFVVSLEGDQICFRGGVVKQRALVLTRALPVFYRFSHNSVPFCGNMYPPFSVRCLVCNHCLEGVILH